MISSHGLTDTGRRRSLNELEPARMSTTSASSALPDPELNVTPLIDILLVLLTMQTAGVVHKGYPKVAL